MTEGLDDKIARVTAELNKLRQQKLEELKRVMRQLEGAGDGAPTRQAYRRFSEQEVKELLEKAVTEAGDEGVSAMKAAEITSIPYTRVRPLMPKLFKKTGAGRSTLYILKPKRGK
ncbi:MAG: hypothetical protein JWM59_4939 [Verrucomicrobiales bacterium]|nr:hypothetical protein [Verrucomicrobiales bacterium]